MMILLHNHNNRYLYSAPFYKLCRRILKCMTFKVVDIAVSRVWLPTVEFSEFTKNAEANSEQFVCGGLSDRYSLHSHQSPRPGMWVQCDTLWWMVEWRACAASPALGSLNTIMEEPRCPWIWTLDFVKPLSPQLSALCFPALKRPPWTYGNKDKKWARCLFGGGVEASSCESYLVSLIGRAVLLFYVNKLSSLAVVLRP